jgi:UDP-glucose:(heptosyl)LPS alpha-1,3-glucosyltransferase
MLRKQLLGLDPGKPCVIFVGSGFYRKGLEFLIEAVGMTKDLQLLVLGHDKSSFSFHRLANKHARGRVVFLGPTHHVKSSLEAADVFCLPSLYDSFSNGALEAACMGVPLVVTQSVGISDYIVHHGGGVICERESSSVKYAIETVLGNAPQFSQRVLKLSDQFDESHLIGEWLSLYQRASQLRDLR